MRTILFLISILLFGYSGAAQVTVVKNDSIVQKIAWYNKAKPSDILFAHFDKTVYTNNENVWFTAYLLNSPMVDTGAVLSVMLLKDDDHSTIIEKKFVMDKGVAFGNLFLADTLLTGHYTFMLYVNNILKGKSADVFRQAITIKNTNELSFSAFLRLPDADLKQNTGFTKVELVTEGGGKLISGAIVNYSFGNKLHPVVAGQVKTDKAGQYLFNVPVTGLAQGNNVFEAEIHFKGEVKVVKLYLPVNEARPEIKFYPEGGYLNENILCNVGWEAKTSSGEPISVKAQFCEDDKSLDTISTDGYGMGAFRFIPSSGKKYSVKLLLGNGTSAIYNLPPVQVHGAELIIRKAICGDTLNAIVKSREPGNVYVLVHNYREVFYSLKVKVNAAGKLMRIDLSALPRGLAEVTVLDSLQRPEAERLFFAHYNRHTNIDIVTDSGIYKKRGLVKLKLKLQNPDGKPGTGLVSVACVQANRFEPGEENNIEWYRYFEHDLGDLPFKTSHFGNDHKNMDYLENILLVKGWRKYSWVEMVQTTPKDTVQQYDDMAFKGAVFKNDKSVKKPLTILLMNNYKPKIIATDNIGNFLLADTDMYATDINKKIALLVAGNDHEDYDVKLIDPYYTINQLVKNTFKPVNYNFDLSRQDNNNDRIAGFEKTINLKEVKVKSARDNFIHGGENANQCGDYVCIYDILNCPNHRTSSANRPAVAGESYYINGRLQIYSGCTVAPKYQNEYNGIYYAMNFYGEDYKKFNPVQPDYISTIFWKRLCDVNATNDTELSFYASDITGDFRIVVQGITDNDVVYGEKFIEVLKSN